MLRHLRIMLACLLGSACIGSSAGADEAVVAAGRIKADQVCSNCHGLDGLTSSGGNSALTPILTAQSRRYLLAKMKAYRDGGIEHAQMTLIARMISEQDIKRVIAWYASVPFKISEIPVRIGELGPVEVCAGCHGLDGQASEPDNPDPIPSLTAQQKEYLVMRLKEYRSGRRKHEQMSAIAQSLSDQDIEAAAAWYSSIGLKVLRPK